MLSVVDLRDGSRIGVRPIEPEDREALASGLERMGAESRYQRFFGPVDRLSESQLTYLTEVDHHDHEALVAFDLETGDGIGVARFVRIDGDVAEPAVAVVDDWQGRGVGGVLLDELANRARAEGIRSFAAAVLAHNAAAVAGLKRLGDTRMASHGREVELLVALEEKRGAVPSLHGLLRHAAEQTIQPSVSFWHRLAVGRRDAVEAHANSIVVAVPATRGSYPPLRQATHLAIETGAAVHLVAARRLLIDGDAPAIEARMSEIAEGLRARGLTVECHSRRGDVAAVLLEIAGRDGAELIVVDGSPPGRRLQGATWDHVAHHAPCNVLVAR